MPDVIERLIDVYRRAPRTTTSASSTPCGASASSRSRSASMPQLIKDRGARATIAGRCVRDGGLARRRPGRRAQSSCRSRCGRRERDAARSRAATSASGSRRPTIRRALAGDLAALPLIAVDFPQVHRRPRLFDRRGCCASATAIAGELRAIGDVLRDQLFALARMRLRRVRAARGPRPATRRAGRRFDDFSAASTRRRRDAAALVPPPAHGSAAATAHDDSRSAGSRALRATSLARDRGASTRRRRSPRASAPRTWCVIDLIATHGLPIRVFTLDTGRLPDETHALIDRARKRYGLPIDVYAPDRGACEAFVRAHGVNAFYDSVELRKAAARSARSSRWRARWPAKGAWITGLRREQSVTRADAAARGVRRRARHRRSSTRWPTGHRRRLGLHPRARRARTTRCTTAAILASAARRARAPSSPARTSAPAAGGGRAPDAQGMRAASAPVAIPIVVQTAARSRDAMIAEAARFTCADRPPPTDARGARRRRPSRLARGRGDPHPARGGGRSAATRRCCSPAARIRWSLLRLAEKAFRPRRVPLPAAAHRHRPQLPRGDRLPRRARGRARRAPDRAHGRGLDRAPGASCCARRDESRNAHQSVTLLDAIAEFGFDACIGGARRDEEKARAKERDLLVPRRVRPVGSEEPAARAVEPLQRAHRTPARTSACSRSPTGPSSTCGSTSRAKRLAVPSIYFAHTRPVVRRGSGCWCRSRR